MSKELKGPRISNVDEIGGYYTYPESDDPNIKYRVVNTSHQSYSSSYIIPQTYSIPIYENSVKTEWTVDGIVGDEKWRSLIEVGNGKLPDAINTKTKHKK